VSRVVGRRLLKGREASRCRRDGEESAAVSCERRVVRGPAIGAAGSIEEGGGLVRALAMLHELAPRSRT